MQRLLILGVVLPLCVHALGEPRKRQLTVAEGRELVAAALGPDIRALPRFRIDYDKNANLPGFYVFEATAEHPRQGSPFIGDFAVNRITAEVWRLGFCDNLKSEALMLLQETVRKRIGFDPGDLPGKAPCER